MNKSWTLQHLDADVYFLETSLAVILEIHKILTCIRLEHMVIMIRLVIPDSGSDLSPLGMNGTDGHGA